MVSFTAVTGPAVAKAYDFSVFKKIVDVGGGHGALLAAIASTHPGVSGTVFDRPEVVAGAKPFLASHGGPRTDSRRASTPPAAISCRPFPQALTPTSRSFFRPPGFE